MPALGCTPHTCKVCTCSASRQKKEPSVATKASMDGGAHTSEIKSWSGTPLCAVNSWQGLRAVFILWGRRGHTSYRGTDIRLAHRLQGKRVAKEYVPHGSLLGQSLARAEVCMSEGQSCE